MNEIEQMAEEFRQQFQHEIETSNEPPAQKAGLIAMFKSMSIEEFIQIAYPGYRPEGNLKETEVEWLQPYSKRMSFDSERNSKTFICWLNGSIVRISWRIAEGVVFTCYFSRIGEEDILAFINLKDLFNMLWGREVTQEKVLPLLPESIERRYPIISSYFTQTWEEFDDERMCLNTIGLGHQPKEWRLMRHIHDLQEWVDLKMYGPERSRVICNCIDDLAHASCTIIHEIIKGGDKKFIAKMRKCTGYSWKD